MLRGGAQMAEEAGQGVDVLPVDLDQLQAREAAVNGLDQRALAHAACAPQERVIGGKAPGETLGIRQEHVAAAVDALEERQRHPIDRPDRQKGPGVRLENEGIGGLKVG